MRSQGASTMQASSPGDHTRFRKISAELVNSRHQRLENAIDGTAAWAVPSLR
jgi:hypothetical protein